jgi:hypothetical protein
MELNLIGHLIILFYLVFMCNWIELFSNRFKGIEWYVPSGAGLILFVFLEFLYWIVFVFVKFAIN